MTPLSKYEDLNEEELMRLYQDDNDLDALGEMSRLLLPKLKKYAWKFADKNSVDEVVSESWIKIHKAAERFRHDSKVQTWAYEIVKNVSSDIRKREMTRSNRNDDISEIQDEEDHFAEFANNSADKIVLQAALNQIPKDQADVIVLKELYGHSDQSAAEKLGIPIGTVKSRHSRGIIALRKALSELDPKARNQKHA
jgi:RNA polymerase sigma-70 factor (ECF subfamily)